MKILNFGSLNLDYVYHVGHFVKAGETISSESRSIFCGGKGLNQSIALARSGAYVWHAGAIGALDGEVLEKTLKNSGVNTEYLKKLDNVPTGHAIIQVDSAGQNCILLFGGANQCIDLNQVDETLKSFSEGDFLLLQNEINELPYIMKKAHERGMKIVLNPSPMNKKILELPLKYVDYFILNEVEMAGISGESEEEKQLKALKEQYPEAAIVLTLGSKGVRFVSKDLNLSHDIFKVSAIDTTAAGDTFTGFFFGCLVQGKTVAEALKTASMASAIAVSREGAEPSIPLMAEVTERLKTI